MAADLHPIGPYDALRGDGRRIRRRRDIGSPDEQGEAAARQFHAALVAYAYALLPDRAGAEDAVQNAYLVITRNYDTFTPGTSVIAWCRSIVRLEVLQIIRKTGREIPTEDVLLFDSIADSFEKLETPDRKVIRSERRRKLAGCLERLPERSRVLVSGRYLEGLGLSALASGMDMTEAAVRKSIYRIRQVLRQCMEEEAPTS